MPLLRALRQLKSADGRFRRGEVFHADTLRAAELLKKTPQIVELVDEAQPVKPTPPTSKVAAHPVTSEKVTKKK